MTDQIDNIDPRTTFAYTGPTAMARYLGVSVATIKLHCQEGNIAHIVIPGPPKRIWITAAEVNRVAEQGLPAITNPTPAYANWMAQQAERSEKRRQAQLKAHHSKYTGA